MKEWKHSAVPVALLAAVVLASLAPAQSGLETRKITIRGRCIDSNGKPVSRCTVKLSGHQATGYPLHWGLCDWCDPVPITTGEDGCFRFDIPLPSGKPLGAGYPSRYHINITHVAHASWFSHCNFRILADIGNVDYGDIQLPRGERPRIKVVDKDGRPQHGVRLELVREVPATLNGNIAKFGPASAVSRWEILRTDIDGYLHFREPLAPGTWFFRTKELQTLRKVPKLKLPRKDLFEIRVASAPKKDVIAGRVVNADGVPVGRMNLAVGNQRGRHAYFKTSLDGRFFMQRPAQGYEGDVAIVMRPKNRRYDDWVEIAEVSWGERRAKITLPAMTRVTFQVSMRGSRKPVQDYNLYCIALDRKGHATPARPAGRFPGGKVRESLIPGHYRILVYPRIPGVAPSTWKDLEVGDQPVTLKVILDTVPAKVIQLRDAKRRPIKGALVEVVSGSAPGRWDSLALLSNFFPGIETTNQRRQPESVVVARARTDVSGRVTVTAPLQHESVALRVHGPGIQTTVQDVTGSWHRDKEISLVVPMGARLSGQVSPLERINVLDVSTPDERTKALRNGRSRTEYGASLADLMSKRRPGIVVFVGGSEERFGNRVFTLDERGAFSCKGLPPGKVRLGLVRFLRKNPRYAAEDPKVFDLGEFDVSLEKPTKLQLSLPKSAFGR